MSKKRGHEEHEEHIDETWLIPYADLLTLLLALFIVLFATSSVDEAKLAAMAQAFYKEFGGTGILPQIGTGVIPLPSLAPPYESSAGDDQDDGHDEGAEQKKFEEMMGDLQVLFDEAGIGASIVMSIDTRGLVITLREAVLFDSGKALIKDEYKDTLIQIGSIINRVENYIRVEGHTDNVPINTFQFPNNWHLSVIRAATVVDLLTVESGIPNGKISPGGYGENRPLADNSTPEGRAQNRRVNIIILSSKFDTLEGAESDIPIVPEAIIDHSIAPAA